MQQRKLERDPSCMVAYRSATNKKLNNFLLACRDSTIQIFSEFNLVWAAKVCCRFFQWVCCVDNGMFLWFC